MDSDDPIIRPARETDFERWLPLWQGYQEFYRARIPDEATRATWNRFFDEKEPVYCLVAERNGKLVGLAHYLFHRSTWLVEPSCYLNDLFVDPSGRRSRPCGPPRAERRACWARSGCRPTSRRLRSSRRDP